MSHFQTEFLSVSAASKLNIYDCIDRCPRLPICLPPYSWKWKCVFGKKSKVVVVETGAICISNPPISSHTFQTYLTWSFLRRSMQIFLNKQNEWPKKVSLELDFSYYYFTHFRHLKDFIKKWFFIKNIFSRFSRDSC